MCVLLPIPASGKILSLPCELAGVISIGCHAIDVPSSETSRSAPSAIPTALRSYVTDVAVITSATGRSGSFNVVPANAKFLFNRRLNQS